VPSWNGLRFSAKRDLILFAFSDKASQEKLNLYKEDRE
jgi:gentisate 1,2-dioxygenase